MTSESLMNATYDKMAKETFQGSTRFVDMILGNAGLQTLIAVIVVVFIFYMFYKNGLKK